MKRRVLFLLSIVAVGAISGYAQRTVTNADLERYRQERLRAEADLRDNYARLGFASPEVMAARNEESARATLELAEQLRTARIERERIAADIHIARMSAIEDRERPSFIRESPYDVDANLGIDGGYGDYGYGGFYDGRRFNDRRGRFGVRRTEGYFAGGQFWPTGPRTRSRPLIAKPRNSRPNPGRRR